MNKDSQTRLRQLPGVDKLLCEPEIKEMIAKYGAELITFTIRAVLAIERENILAGKANRPVKELISTIISRTKNIAQPSLKPVINATGIVLHTNLSRAPLGDNCLQKISPVLAGYSNLEFDLKKGKRGQRNDHIRDLLQYITGAENALVVNNNAAAVYLSLLTFSKNKEVIISRGELIEIGGSFRIPDIIKISGAKMVEVGTTNRTRLADYEAAITDKTRVIFKAHKSNYEIRGFSQEVATTELAELAHKHDLLMIYDIGSGLLRKPERLDLKREPDVKGSLRSGVDLVSFSGDKLLGGPQAGIIAGRDKLIKKLARSPLMRALRVGKMTMAALQHAVAAYLNDTTLIGAIPIFNMLNRTAKDLRNSADQLRSQLAEKGIKSEIVASKAQVGGGTLPGVEIESFGVQLSNPEKDRKFAQRIFRQLLELDEPILAILREGNLVFDVLTLFRSELEAIPETLQKVISVTKK